MKIQSLAVIAIIIILPMAMILSSYTENQIKTLNIQISYDSKLTNATYDAIKVFQLNMSNSSTSDLANSKMRDIKASVNTFYNSLSSNFNMSGYGKDVLQSYVPVIVYTLYDGYYIYSDYENKLDSADTFKASATYKNGEDLYGLKPYIYYSCRYKNRDCDVTITYSLDSYITIQGTVASEPINESGYLLTGVKEKNGQYLYREIPIEKESGISQNVYVQGEGNATGTSVYINNRKVGAIGSYLCKKVNGVKYYQDSSNNEKFAIINDVKYNQNLGSGVNFNENANAVEYYKKAYEFKQKIQNSALNELSSSDAVDSYGKKYTDYSNDVEKIYTPDIKIFDELFNSENEKYIEDTDSYFNEHKLQVIKNSIESNLIVAISNYNNISDKSVNFSMPKLTEEEWEQLSNNICVLTFLQGLNIGGKVYNGYSIVPNNNNEDFVSEDSIYIIGSDNNYYKVTDSKLLDNSPTLGIYNTDLQRRVSEASLSIDGAKTTKTLYYYPRNELAAYTNIVGGNTSVSKYLNSISDKDKRENLSKIYYTALGRERFGQYRVTNKLEEIQEYLQHTNE